jgi:RNA polymerase sigma-70 factor, ECF subfamily
MQYLQPTKPHRALEPHNRMQTIASFENEALPHLDAVYRFAFRLAGSAADAEDLVQETYLRAYRSWDRYEPGTRAKSWLFTICRNAFLRQRQHDSRRDEVMQKAVFSNGPTEFGAESVLFMPAYQQDPEGTFFFSVIDRSILEMINGIQPDFREVVLLSDLEGLSYAEIAEVLDVPIGTVKSRLFRGRRMLQEKLYSVATESGYVQPRAI